MIIEHENLIKNSLADYSPKLVEDLLKTLSLSQNTESNKVLLTFQNHFCWPKEYFASWITSILLEWDRKEYLSEKNGSWFFLVEEKYQKSEGTHIHVFVYLPIKTTSISYIQEKFKIIKKTRNSLNTDTDVENKPFVRFIGHKNWPAVFYYLTKEDAHPICSKKARIQVSSYLITLRKNYLLENSRAKIVEEIIDHIREENSNELENAFLKEME